MALALATAAAALMAGLIVLLQYVEILAVLEHKAGGYSHR